MVKRYTETHEWVEIIDDNGPTTARLGISNHAQKALGTIVVVEPYSITDHYKKKESVASIDSVKAASDIYTPVNCAILNYNRKLDDNPELVNEDPLGEGWILEIEVEDVEELLAETMEEEEYNRLNPDNEESA